MAEERQRKFLKGAVILAVAGILNKVLGAVFRIPLTNWIGAEGMAYYGVAYSIYSALVVIGTAGVPVAVSRLVSENIAVGRYKNAHKIFHIAFLIMLGIGIVCSCICFFGADVIAVRVSRIPQSALALRAMAPALLFVPMFSTFRGFFNGRQNMNPTALSEITEQLVRCITGLVLAYYFAFKVKSAVQSAAGATFGASAGALAGLLIIFLIFLLNRKNFRKKIESGDQTEEGGGELAKKIIVIAVPIIIGCEIMPIMTLVDTAIVTRVLQATGWTAQQSEYLYGLFSGFCNALIAFPQIFTQAVAVSLVPAISAHYRLKDMQKANSTIDLGYRTTMIMAFPCAFGIFVLAEPILKLLYFQQPQACHDAAPTLMVMAISIIFLAIMQTSTSVLQSVGKQTIPVRNLAIGCAGKVFVTYFLVGVHSVNIMGAAFGTMFAYVVAMILNGLAVRKYTGIRFRYGLTYARPGIAAALMAAWAFGIYHLLSFLLDGHSPVMVNMASAGIAILSAMVVYAFLIFAVKAISLEELSEIPHGDRLARIMGRFIK